MTTKLTPREFHEAGVADWRVVGDGACAYFRTGSFPAGVGFVAAIGEAIDAGKYPDVDLRDEGVTLRLVTIGAGLWGLTDDDLALAWRISEVAAEMGIPADPSAVQTVQVTVAAHLPADVMPFWKAVLGYKDLGEEDLIDPHRRGAPFWFQPLAESHRHRSRIHVDVFVPPDQGESRLAAAIAAGGQLRDDRGPAWWTLADPVGNVVDLATQDGRD